jgi:DNA-binding NarL/FixJ family response regulator
MRVVEQRRQCRAGIADGCCAAAVLYSGGQLAEGREWLTQLLDRSVDRTPTRERAMALATAAKLAAHHGDDGAALDYAAAYQALPPELQNLGSTADLRAALCVVNTRRGHLEAAHAYGSAAVSLALDNHDPIDAALFRNYLAAVLHRLGELDAAEALYAQSLAEARELDYRLCTALSLEGLASIARARGDVATARRLYREALSVFRDMSAMLPAIQTLIGLGYTALDQDDLGSARRDFGEALDLALGIGQRLHAVAALEGMALVAAAQHRPERVVKLLAAVERLRADAGGPPASAAVEAALAAARDQLGEAWAEQLRIEGKAMTHEQAVSCAREGGQPGPRLRSATATALSERELQVVNLLVRGLSNRAIAERLVISVRTVDRHVENILAKLELSSRGQIVAWAIEHNATHLADAATHG